MEPSGPTEYQNAIARHYGASRSIASQYQPTPYRGNVVVIESSDPALFRFARWNKLLTGRAQYHRIESSHEQLVKRPQQIGEICSILRGLP